MLVLLSHWSKTSCGLRCRRFDVSGVQQSALCGANVPPGRLGWVGPARLKIRGLGSQKMRAGQAAAQLAGSSAIKLNILCCYPYGSFLHCNAHGCVLHGCPWQPHIETIVVLMVLHGNKGVWGTS